MVFSIHRRPSWAIDECRATPERAFLDRRSIIKGFGLGLVGAAALVAANRPAASAACAFCPPQAPPGRRKCTVPNR